MFDCKKCPVHWGSFIKHHGLFVPYIVDIFDCEKYNIHLVSFIKNHGLFVPYIDDIFIFLIRISWLSPLHTFTHSKSFKFLLARKSWFSFPNITESKSTFFILGPRKTRLLSTVEALTTSRVPTYVALIGVNVIRTTIRYNLLLYAYKTSKG